MSHSARTRMRTTFKKTGAWVQALMLASAAILPLMNASHANAEQLSDRKVTTSTSVASATGVTYTFQFDWGTTGNVGSMVIDFCTTPLINTTCTAPTGLSTASTAATGWTVTPAFTNSAVLLDRTAASETAGATETITLTGMVNPSGAQVNTVFARILSYAAQTGAGAADTDYVSATSVGTYIDFGTVASAINNQLTITARVQEVLQFCVGTTDAGSNNDCTDISGTSIDLGVLDSASINESADGAGLAMVRTNAVSGVNISYFSQQETSSGLLKVAGQTCDAGQDVGSGSETDQCINSSSTEDALVSGQEQFGVSNDPVVNTTNGTTTNLTRDAAYTTNGSYAWNKSTTPDTIASSTTVVDDEMLLLVFGAAASATTPTGQYSVTATFVATPTF